VGANLCDSVLLHGAGLRSWVARSACSGLLPSGRPTRAHGAWRKETQSPHARGRGVRSGRRSLPPPSRSRARGGGLGFHCAKPGDTGYRLPFCGPECSAFPRSRATRTAPARKDPRGTGPPFPPGPGLARVSVRGHGPERTPIASLRPRATRSARPPDSPLLAGLPPDAHRAP
jgi:hypothetical protein